MAKDYYQILGVDKSATPDQIKKAFRAKAHQHHPDKGGGNAEKFKEANEAYQVLGNPEKKKQYDQFGSTFSGGSSQGPFGGGFNWSDMRGAGFGPSAGSGGVNFDFSDLGDIFGDLFGQGARTRGQRGTRSRRGSDIEASLTVDFTEAVFGAEQIIELNKNGVCSVCHGSGAEIGAKTEICPACQGSGQVTITQQTFFGAFRSTAICSKCSGEGKVINQPCKECRGSGTVKSREKIKVKIPAGISDGETIKLSGQGEAGQRGASSGDLYLNIRVRPSLEFERKGDDLYTVKTIAFSQAALGDKVRIKTLEGEVELKIPAGTHSGKQFILKDKGVPHLRSRGRGSLIVEVKVAVPQSLSRSQKKMLEDLAREGL